jgi:3-oxoacyl-[acyl-carrier protein] reductase
VSDFSTTTAARHVLISGGSRGLGQSLVTGLLDAGYLVSTFSRRRTEFTEQNAANPNFFFKTADIADAKSLDGCLRASESKLGPFYGLINCAGIAADGVLATMPEQQLESVVSVNLTGALRLTRRVLRRMLLNSTGGVIINVSSIIGLRGYSGLAAYAATKAGMDAMTRSLARELGHRQIRVNSIAPGYLETEMTHGLSAEQKDQVVRRTPLGRLGRPADVVGPVRFLLSDDAALNTGQVLVVDGGITT